MSKDRFLGHYYWNKSTDEITYADVEETEELMKWASFHEDINSRRVAMDEVNGITVFTSFLGTDHSFSTWDEDRPPILFETLPRRGLTEWMDQWQQRFAHSVDALAYHNALVFVIVVTGGLPDGD